MEQEEQKIGSGHVKAMLRQGAKELAQVLPAFPSSGIQPVEEPGTFGNLTPQEVVASKGLSYEDFLGQRTPQVEPAKDQEMER